MLSKENLGKPGREGAARLSGRDFALHLIQARSHASLCRKGQPSVLSHMTAATAVVTMRMIVKSAPET